MPRIRLNGEERDVRAQTVAALVEELGLAHRYIASERNREVVPKSAWASSPVAEGDRIEIVQMIGGG